MAIYAAGDIQGCLDELRDLLDRLEFDPLSDRLWLVGDLVNRGPRSLETLRYVRSLGDAAVSVLGNHDLHLLALACNATGREAEPELQALLQADDRDELLHWLRQRPLLHYDAEQDALLVHAGIYPGWDVKKSLRHAAEVESVLRSDQYEDFFRQMYGARPDAWSDSLQSHERLRFIVNSFTRMRYCRPDGSLDFAAKLAPEEHSAAGLLPWFRLPARRAEHTRVFFGHWSTLGYIAEGSVIGLDTGCVWGGTLTAVRVDAPAEVIQVPSRQAARF